jgi:hypothetical protein
MHSKIVKISKKQEREQERDKESLKKSESKNTRTNDVGGAKQEEKIVTGKGLHNSDKRAEMNVVNYNNPSRATHP